MKLEVPKATQLEVLVGLMWAALQAQIRTRVLVVPVRASLPALVFNKLREAII